jgi:hypothetical protein
MLIFLIVESCFFEVRGQGFRVVAICGFLCFSIRCSMFSRLCNFFLFDPPPPHIAVKLEAQPSLVNSSHGLSLASGSSLSQVASFWKYSKLLSLL